MQKSAPYILANRYEVGEVVGRGSYGMVCRGVDLRTGRKVALKMLSPAAGEDPNAVERMLREQQAMVALEGTCAVTAIDLCKLPGGAPCLVMEWLEGCDLERQLEEWNAAGVRPGVDRLLEVLRPLTETLHRAHEIGIVHRDVKPANIFLTTGVHRGVRLLDFGLSRMTSAAPLTELGMVMGSPSYIAPETWGGNSALIDHRADLYSLAVIVFRWLAGKPPFDTPNLLNKMILVTTAERPGLSEFRPDLPASIDPWLQRGLAIDRNVRFQSARELYATLSIALEANPSANSEASGIPEDPAGSSALRLERPSVLSVAWSAATALLRRFTGQSDSQPTHSPPSASASTPIDPVSGESDVAESSGDRGSVWLDESDLEERPKEEEGAELRSRDNLSTRESELTDTTPPDPLHKKLLQKKVGAKMGPPKKTPNKQATRKEGSKQATRKEGSKQATRKEGSKQPKQAKKPRSR